MGSPAAIWLRRRCRKLEFGACWSSAAGSGDRSIGKVDGGGGSFSGRGRVGCLLVVAAVARAGLAGAAVGAREGDRDLAAPPPAAGAAAPGCASRADAGGSDGAGGLQPRPSTAGVAEVSVCEAGDAFAVAPRAGRPSVDVSASPSRAAADA